VCDGPSEIGRWIRMFEPWGEDCHITACGGHNSIEEDDCDNELKIACLGPFDLDFPPCAWRFYYNDNFISKCIWITNGTNIWYYKYKEYDNGLNQFHMAKHSTFDNDGDESCTGYYCAKLTYYDCLNEQIFTTCWRKTPYQSIPVTCTEGEQCPGH
jgi:hypothetical protein